MKMILNLGCGAKTSPLCVNIDRNIQLRIARNPVLYHLGVRILSKARAQHLLNLRTNIQMHDLSKGIPYPDNSVDAVYHSHVLEHIDRVLSDPARDPARVFLRECRRVLKPGGILRVVVPDLERRCRRYIAVLDRAKAGNATADEVNEAVDKILGQAVRREASGTSRQSPALRFIENILLGDARKRGETHQWEYDSVSLASLLREVGFEKVAQVDYETSKIPRWQETGLDTHNGDEYKPGSLYMEAVN